MSEWTNPHLAGIRAPINPLSVLQHEEEEPMGLIQGQEPRSRNEWNTAKGLYALNHVFIYQYAVYGTRGLRGEIYIDFLVLTTPPRPTPLETLGQRWHTGQLGEGDREREIEINDIARDKGWQEVIFLFEHETEDPGVAYNALISKIGRR